MISADSLEATELLNLDASRANLTSDEAPLHPLFVVLAVFLGFDFLAPIVLGLLAYRAHAASGPTFWAVCGKFSVVAAVLATLVFRWVGCYRTELLLDRGSTYRTLLKGFGWLIAIGFATAFLSKSLNQLSRVWTVLWLGSWVASAIALRAYATRSMAARAAAGRMVETVAIVGATDWALHVCAQMIGQRRPGLRIVGVFDDRRARLTPQLAHAVRPVDELLELGRRVHIDRVVLALPLHAEARILELSRRIMALSVDILACPDLRGFDLLRRPVVSQSGLPAIRICDRPMRGVAYFVKVIADKVIGAALLLLLSPLLLGIALAIRLSGPGPILFRQKRHGFNNREFEVLKFRTMRVDASDPSGGRQARRNDRRITRFGRFLRRSSLDELPQLINVLRGDMSLVGPRPLPVGMRTRDLLNHEIVDEYAHRHRVRPGITGWAQINGFRGATEEPGQLQKRVELDLDYIENWSLGFDLRILLLTGVHLISSKNAF